MLDEFLKFGAGFDWITPLWAFIQDAHYGQPFQINVPYDAGWSGSQIILELNEKGIRTWGLMVVGETITFTVRRCQARYALYWLDRWGVPYQAKVDRLPDIRNAGTSDVNFDGAYEETIYTPLGKTDHEVEYSSLYKEGLIEYSLRSINVAADRLFGEK